MLGWRRGAGPPNIQALQQLLHEDGPALRRGTNRKNRPANGL
jgi:hypothetical protein